MGGAVFPPCCLTWGQTMVEVMMIMAPNPASGHHWPMPPLETPGHSQASLGQSLVGSMLLSPGSWCTQDFVCVLQESVSPVLCKFWWLYGGVNGNLLQEGLCHTQSTEPRGPAPADPYLHRKHSNIVLAQSLWGLWVLVCTRFVWTLQVSLADVGFDSNPNFTPLTILLGLFFCPWKWGIFFSWDPAFSCQWLFSSEL